MPRYNDNDKPVYPWRSRLQGEQGTVLLSVRISERGHVSDVRVVQSSGSEALDEAARTAVKRWTFHPARRDGHPVEVDVHVPVQFRLEK
jgi:protein TonB